MKLETVFVGQIGNWIIGVVSVLLIAVSVLLAYTWNTYSAPASSDDVASFVRDFGDELQNVSLLAPAADVKATMEARYGKYLSRELLDAWEADPKNALGRTTSSPYPTGIRVGSVQNLDGGSYIVKAYVEQGTTGTTTVLSESQVYFGVTREYGDLKISEYSAGTKK